jgi:hypothetical protein
MYLIKKIEKISPFCGTVSAIPAADYNAIKISCPYV